MFAQNVNFAKIITSNIQIHLYKVYIYIYIFVRS